MKRALRRQIRILQLYAAGSSLAIVAVASAGMTQSTATQRIDELTVQRLNVVDANRLRRRRQRQRDECNESHAEFIRKRRSEPDTDFLARHDRASGDTRHSGDSGS